MNLKVDNDRTIGLSSILCSDANGDIVSVSEYVIPVYKLRITGESVGKLGITNVNVYDSEGNEVVLSDPSASSTAEGYSAEDALDGVKSGNTSDAFSATYGLTGWLSEAESSASYWEAEFLEPISKVVIHYFHNSSLTSYVENFKVEILDSNNNDAQLNNLGDGDTLGGQKFDGSVYINSSLAGIYKETIDEIVMNLPSSSSVEPSSVEPSFTYILSDGISEFGIFDLDGIDKDAVEAAGYSNITLNESQFNSESSNLVNDPEFDSFINVDDAGLLTPLDSFWVIYHNASGTQFSFSSDIKSLDDWTELTDEAWLAAGIPPPTKQYIVLLKTN